MRRMQITKTKIGGYTQNAVFDQGLHCLLTSCPFKNLIQMKIYIE